MRAAWRRRSFSHTAAQRKPNGDASSVPDLVKQARERLHQRQQQQAATRAAQQQQQQQASAFHRFRLPPMTPQADPTEGAHVQQKQPQPVLPRFRRDTTSPSARDLLSLTDYDHSTSELQSPATESEREQAHIARLPLYIESCAEVTWRRATQSDFTIRHATVALVRRCARAKERRLAKSVVDRKIALDGLPSVEPAAWHALGHPTVQLSLLLAWLDRLEHLTGHEFETERASWKDGWDLLQRQGHLHNEGEPVAVALVQQLVGTWAQDGNKEDLLSQLRSSFKTTFQPFPWHPHMSEAVQRWLGALRQQRVARKEPTEPVLQLSHLVRTLFPPPPSSPPPPMPPALQTLEDLKRAYETHETSRARSILTQLQADNQLEHLPPQHWRSMCQHDPALLIWSALQHLLSLDLSQTEQRAWCRLYESVAGPSQPHVRANTQAGLEVDRAVRQWLTAGEGDATATATATKEQVLRRVRVWTDQEFGRDLCDFTPKKARHFLRLCKSRDDLRKDITVLLGQVGRFPIRHKQRFQMQILHTLLAVNYKHEPSKALVALLEDYMHKVWQYDPATSLSPPPLDSGVLRPLWLNLEERAPVFDSYVGLLDRALFFVNSRHPYLGPAKARGMQDAAAILTRLASKEMQHYQSHAQPDRAEKLQQKLFDALKDLNLQVKGSRGEEKDKFRVLGGSMAQARKANLDWTGFFQVAGTDKAPKAMTTGRRRQSQSVEDNKK